LLKPPAPLPYNSLVPEVGAAKSVPATAAVNADVPLPLTIPVSVPTPVPPFVTASVPARVMVPDVVIGPPEVVKPVVPPDTATLDTVAEDDAEEASSVTTPALFLAYSFMSAVLSANSPATRLPAMGKFVAVLE
jgi:hypothetical protein